MTSSIGDSDDDGNDDDDSDDDGNDDDDDDNRINGDSFVLIIALASSEWRMGGKVVGVGKAGVCGSESHPNVLFIHSSTAVPREQGMQ